MHLRLKTIYNILACYLYSQVINWLCVKRAVMLWTQSMINAIHNSFQSRGTDLVLFGTTLLISTAHLLQVISYQVYYLIQRNVYKQMTFVSLLFSYNIRSIHACVSFYHMFISYFHMQLTFMLILRVSL